MKKQDLLIILIPTCIFVFAWIGFNVYHNAVAPTISDQEINQVAPINPNFDTSTISKLKTRVMVEQALQGTASATPIPTPTLVVKKSTATQSAQTAGGKLK